MVFGTVVFGTVVFGTVVLGPDVVETLEVTRLPEVDGLEDVDVVPGIVVVGRVGSGAVVCVVAVVDV